jgi:hypothetical protein
MTLSADVDALIVVTKVEKLRQGTMDETQRLLTSMRAHQLGFVLAGAEQGPGYGYGYGYGYPRREPREERRGGVVT